MNWGNIMRKIRFYNKLLAPILFFIIIITLSIPFITPSKGTVITCTLGYGDYYHITKNRLLNSNVTIDWDFNGNNSLVGITVMVFNRTNWEQFQKTLHGEGYVLSDGSFYSDYGHFEIPYTDYWHIVFLHHDNSAFTETTTITIIVSFIGPYTIPDWLITLLITLATMVVVIFGIFSLSKFTIERNDTLIQESIMTHVKKTETLNQQKKQELLHHKTIQCYRCGEINSFDKRICNGCHKKLIRIV